MVCGALAFGGVCLVYCLLLILEVLLWGLFVLLTFTLCEGDFCYIGVFCVGLIC